MSEFDSKGAILDILRVCKILKDENLVLKNKIDDFKIPTTSEIVSNVLNDLPPIDLEHIARLVTVPDPIQGEQGAIGADGADGSSGRDGRDGRDGVIDEKTIRNIIKELPKNEINVELVKSLIIEQLPNYSLAEHQIIVKKGKKGNTGSPGIRGEIGPSGKDGVSVTKVELDGDKLYYWLGDKKKYAGAIALPAIYVSGGGGRQPQQQSGTVEGIDQLSITVPAGSTGVLDTLSAATRKTAKWLIRIENQTTDEHKSMEVVGMVIQGANTAHAISNEIGDFINHQLAVNFVSSSIELQISNNEANPIIVRAIRLAVIN